MGSVPRFFGMRFGLVIVNNATFKNPDNVYNDIEAMVNEIGGSC